MGELAINGEMLSALCLSALDLLERAVIVSNREMILFANQATAQILCAGSASELIGLSTEELAHPDSRSTATMRRELVADLGQDLCELPTKIIARDGSIISQIVDVCPATFEEQIVFVYNGRIPSDGANRNGGSLAAAGRADRHGLFDTILEAVPDIVLIHDEERILFANAACRRFLSAQSPEDLEGRPVDVIIHPDAFAAGRERRRLLLDGGRHIKGIPLKIVSLRNQTKHVTVDAYPLAFDGAVVAAAIVAPAMAE